MNKTALITGASGGIGLELAKIHAAKGRDLVLVARSLDKLIEIKGQLEDEFGVSVITIGKDLSIIGSAKDVYEEIKTMGIKIDYLINNAGFADFGLFWERDWSTQLAMINLNVATLAEFSYLYVEEMVDRGSGKILNVASTAAFLPGPLMSVYYATKAFVLHFSEALDNEVRDKGVSVTALCPGATKSGFQSRADMEDSGLVKNRKLPSSEKVAKFGYEAMESGKRTAIEGFANKLTVFTIRFLPRNFKTNLVRKIQAKK